MSNGFTLIEALVALVVLTVAIGPAIALAGSALRISTSIKDNLIATGLAQEGIEVVRSIRDDNWLTDTAFESGLGSCQIGCSVSWGTGVDTEQPIGTQQNEFLSLDPATGRYGYALSDKSIFKRVITIIPNPDTSPIELVVTSEVMWKQAGQDRSVKLESHLFNWK